MLSQEITMGLMDLDILAADHQCRHAGLIKGFDAALPLHRPRFLPDNMPVRKGRPYPIKESRAD